MKKALVLGCGLIGKTVALDLAQFWDDICTTMYHSIDTALNYYTYNYVAMSLIPTFSEPFAISNVGVI